MAIAILAQAGIDKESAAETQPYPSEWKNHLRRTAQVAEGEK